MEKDLKQQIVKSAMAVKRKVEMIKAAKNSSDLALDTIFRPIVRPLNQLANKNKEKHHPEKRASYNPPLKKIKSSKSENSHASSQEADLNEDFDESLSEDFNDNGIKGVVEEEEYDDDFDEPLSEDFNDNGSEGVVEEEEHNQDLYQKSNKTLIASPKDASPNVSVGSFKSFQSSPSIKSQSLSWSTSSEVMNDIPFGIKNERGKLILGKTRVHDDGETLKIGNRTFKRTLGLKELLYQRKPNLQVITDNDLQNYKLLLLETNAHRRNCDPTKPINSNKGFKYMNIIKPLFKHSRNLTTSTESISEGKGLKLMKNLKNNTDYIYWDDPNELVERLKLLFASRDAGNTGLDNEIIAIIEELQEAGIINKNK
jgi:hypothetical protein